jgi:RES domain
MPFKSVHDYSNFTRAVQTKRRFIYSDEVSSFLKAVVETSSGREGPLRQGTVLWRAQIGSRPWSRKDDGHEREDRAPFPPERMLPQQPNPYEGRVNPRGMAYLYLASDRQTAIAEVRPWAGALISLAAFKTSKELRLIDCSKRHGQAGGWAYLLGVPQERWDKLSPEEVEQAVWASIDNAFSEPVGPSDEHIDYVPTQIIAETFVDKGFDGIIYRSALNEKGLNVALFGLSGAVLDSCQLFKVSRTEYAAEEWSNAWFLRDGNYFTQVITDIRPVDETDRKGTTNG